MAENETDGALVKTAANGDRNAFTTLVERYAGPMGALAYDRLGSVADAQDAVQDTFVTAFERLGTLRDADRFAAWAYEILRNHCALRLRRRGLERRHWEGLFGRYAGTVTFTPLDRLAAEERDVRLRAAVAELSAPLREAVAVRYMGGAGRREAAAILGLSQDAFDKRIERALRELRARLEPDRE